MSAPLRVAVVYDCLFPFTTGGGERQYRAFAEHLSQRACEVDYLTSQQWAGATPQDPAFAIVPVTKRLELYDPAGVRRTSAALAFAWGIFRSLMRRRGDYDAVIVGALPALNVIAARLALLGSRTRLVADYLEVWGPGQWREYAGRMTGTIGWLAQRLAIMLTPVATCHSSLSARRLRSEGFRRQLLVSPGLIDTQNPPAPSLAPADPPFVLYVGRHIPDKRVELLPRAVAVAREAIPDLRLIILGSGPTTDDVRLAVESVDGGIWTDLRGFVSEEELDRLMAGAAVLVNPSRREGYGLVVVEASAHGTPVVLIADEGNASTELITAGVNGYVAPSIGAADVAAAITSAVSGGPGLRRRTRAWYDEALQSRTIAKTIDGILRALTPKTSDSHSTEAPAADSTKG